MDDTILEQKYAIGSTIPSYWPPSVEDVRYYPGKGPFPTKSGGQLQQTLQVPVSHLFRQQREEEVALVGKDLYADLMWREYFLSELPADGVGGNEFHRLRNELFCVWDGAVDLRLADVYGKEWYITDLSPAHGYLYIPPFVLHTYTVTADNTELKVLADTWFEPEDWRTHDTFGTEAFAVLWAHFTDEET